MKQFKIQQISNNLASEYVVKYHYLHRVPNRKFSFGLFDGDTLIGVCMFGVCPYANVIDRIVGKENADKTLELVRLWVSDDYSIKNIESYFIGKCLSELSQYTIISYADPHAGHRGIIYQATNFKYYGLSPCGEVVNDNGLLTTKYHRKHLYVKSKQVDVKLKELPYPKRDCLIYALLDPDTKAVRYIGISSTGLKRPNEHKKTSSMRYNTHKNNWIKSLLNVGKMYDIRVIEYVNEDELNDRGVYWIAKYRMSGYDLVNATDGGEGTLGMIVTDETKRKISEARKKFYENNPEMKLELSISQRKAIDLIDEIPHFECSDCLTKKPLTEFNRNKSRWSGHNGICKSCEKVRLKARRKYSKMSEQDRLESYEKRKEKMREGVNRAYKTNPDLRKNISKRAKKAIIANNPFTGETLEFDSAMDAKGFNNSNIGQAIKNKTLYRGYYWKFK